MIFDSIENAEIYYGLGEKFQKAFEFLKTADFDKLGTDKIEIDGENIFALPEKYITKNPEEGVWEAHRKYIDIQYMVDGTENIGYVLIDYLDELEDYNEVKDMELLKGEGDYMLINAGEFAVFFPDDAHMPGLKVEENEEVYKVIVKIAL